MDIVTTHIHFFVVTLGILCLYLYLLLHYRYYRRIIHSIPTRILVNGIRGKTRVTSLVTSILQGAGYKTMGKVSGTHSFIHLPDGSTEDVARRGRPNIAENIEMVNRYRNGGLDAIVFETMAINPRLQRITAEKMIHPTITIITNVRKDHEEAMGIGLKRIAESFVTTIPEKGVLITGETNEEIIKILKDAADKKKTKFIRIKPDAIPLDYHLRFGYVIFRDNLAIALEVAKLLNIKENSAKQSMLMTHIDGGELIVKEKSFKGRDLIFVNLFAINDEESMLQALKSLKPERRAWAERRKATDPVEWKERRSGVDRRQVLDPVRKRCTMLDENIPVVGILNNRHDRRFRSVQFADIITKKINFQKIVTIGQGDTLAVKHMIKNGYNPNDILVCGDGQRLSTEEILSLVTAQIGNPKILLVGLGNILTEQAQDLINFFRG